MVKEINLTQGKFALVDDEDYEWLNQWKWYARYWNNKFYATRKQWDSEYKISKVIRMHRLIINAPDEFFVDHKDGNTLNNQKSNLRLCSNQQNIANAKNRKIGKSGFRGVMVYSGACETLFRAYITVNYKTLFLGSYKSPEEAAKVYDEAAKRYFGEFANLNFNDKGEFILSQPKKESKNSNLKFKGNKLTEIDREEILKRIVNGESSKTLANKYEVTQTAISKLAKKHNITILNGKILQTPEGVMNLAQAAKFYGFKKSTLRDRLAAGWNLEKALKTPVKSSHKEESTQC